MSIEDAAALEILMANITSDEDVQDRLRLFEQVRLPRCATTQLMSNAMFYSKVNQEGLVREYYDGPLPPKTAESWSESIRDFFYSYDIFEESKKALHCANKEGVPKGVLKYFTPPW